MDDRRSLIQELLYFSKPIVYLSKELTKFTWDYSGSEEILTGDMILKLIDRFVNDELTYSELIDWANAIECREDIVYEGLNTCVIDELVTILANPDINGRLRKEEFEKYKNRIVK